MVSKPRKLRDRSEIVRLPCAFVEVSVNLLPYLVLLVLAAAPTLSNALLNNNHRGNRDVVRLVAGHHPPTFAGEEYPTVLEEWIRTFDKILDVVDFSKDRRVEMATFYFRQEVDLWWTHEGLVCRKDPSVSWEGLKDKLRERFYSTHVKVALYEEFLHLQQGSSSVMEYHKRFFELARFALTLVPIKAIKVEKFVTMLIEARKALTVSKPRTLSEAYFYVADLYRVQQIQRGVQERRKRKSEGRGAPIYMGPTVTNADPARSFQRNDFNGGKTPQPIGNNAAKGRHYDCKMCGNDHPDVDCHGRLVECFACSKKGHSSFECLVKSKTSSNPSPTGSVRPQSGGQFRSGSNDGGIGGNTKSLNVRLGPPQGKIYVMSPTQAKTN
ncbi:PREDICTED: uncharacterized protein LOC109190942 [Ipomoea nil]|uniref:uncharacterized protein LOC109190942 n=1 Tax=Ipomoea nil TaxID=35883 RepID=UPI0009014497|nr:PREDICTED: uncharacterized protein LOC109190942 [Ipomoea nil]